ncbi:MAG TPA: MAPEG family protein [Rhodanobacter sp.]|nr:MAPEG family protein [Rhodanobacter sp.]
MHELPALATLLTVLLLFATLWVAGRARYKYGVKAPATSGHPAFERAYRVQMNTIEGSVMFLPVLWLAASYGFGGWAGIAGLVWVAGRTWYALAYWADAARRGPGFSVAMLAFLVLLVMAAIGVVRALLLG